MIRAAQLRSVLLWLSSGVGTAIAAALATLAQLQLVIFAVVSAVALMLNSRTRILVFVAMLIPSMGLIRRLTSGDAGRTDSDPLVLLPVILTLAVLLVGLNSPVNSSETSKTAQKTAWFRRASIALLVGVAVTLLVRTAFTVEPIYYAFSIAVPIWLSWAVVSGRIVDVWPIVVRLIPALAVIFGAYGIYQFLFLPEWDRAWMIASDLTSIGQPVPLGVRVFGGSESPGPYSLFMGLGIVVSIGKATVARRLLAQAGWLICSAFLMIPLLLTGVRSALVAVLICVAVLVFVRGRGLGRVVPLALVAVASFVLPRLLNAVEGTSTILTAGRYTDFSSNDGSLQARLGLLSYLSNPLTYIIGDPRSTHLDNLSIDVTVFAGIVPGVAMTVIVFGVGVLAVRNLWRKQGELAAIGSIFIAIMSLSGNVFASPFGLLIGIVFGSVVVTFYSPTSQARDAGQQAKFGLPVEQMPSIRHRYVQRR